MFLRRNPQGCTSRVPFSITIESPAESLQVETRQNRRYTIMKNLRDVASSKFNQAVNQHKLSGSEAGTARDGILIVMLGLVAIPFIAIGIWEHARWLAVVILGYYFLVMLFIILGKIFDF
jgi:hypothetical protein